MTDENKQETFEVSIICIYILFKKIRISKYKNIILIFQWKEVWMFFSLYGIYHLGFWVKKQGSNTKQKTWYSCGVLSIQQLTQKPTVTSHMVVKDISNYFNIGLKESYGFKLKILF